MMRKLLVTGAAVVTRRRAGMRPGLRPRKLLITGTAVAILGVAVAGWALAWGPAAKQPKATPALPPATAKVTRTTLVDTRTLPGTLGYGDPVPISATGTGTLTWIAPVGSIVKQGEPLFKVDERPVVVLYGSVPLYRTLQPSTVLTQTVPTPLQLRVEQAESSARLAKLRLEQLKQGPRSEEIAQAQAEVDSAASGVRSAQAKLDLLKQGATAADVAAAEQAVATAQANVQQAEADLAKVKAGATADELRAAELAIEQAKNSLWAQQISRDATCGRDKGADCQAANAQVAAAETAVTKATEALAALKKGPDPKDVAAKQADLDAAKETLRSAQVKLNQLKKGPASQDVAQAQAAVDVAQATYRSAQAALALKKAPPSEAEVAQAEEQVRQADIALREARTALNDGVKGADVQQLEKNLAELGYTGFTVDDTYTSATAKAVRKWQADLDLPETGIVEPGQVVFTPGPVRIAEQIGRVGDVIGGSSNASGAAGSAGSPEPGASGRSVPVLSYTGTTKLVTVQLGMADQALAVKGRKATVKVPGRQAVEGTISQVSSVLTAVSTTPAPGGPSSAASAARIKVDVAIADQVALGSWDGAPVDVDFVVEERKDVLAVPVAALLALPDGGYGVEVVDGDTTRIIPVKTGVFAGGQVEVSGKGIAEGVTVGVPK